MNNEQRLTSAEVQAITAALNRQRDSLAKLLDCEYMGEHNRRELAAVESAVVKIRNNYITGGVLVCRSK